MRIVNGTFPNDPFTGTAGDDRYAGFAGVDTAAMAAHGNPAFFRILPSTHL